MMQFTEEQRKALIEGEVTYGRLFDAIKGLYEVEDDDSVWEILNQTDDPLEDVVCALKLLTTKPPVAKPVGRTMPRHEFAQMVNELRDVPAVQSKRERIVHILHAFNINPDAPEKAE